MEWYQILLRLFISTVVGASIGFEREKHGHPAGIKTHIMVCVGATVASIIEVLLKKQIPDIDMTRIVAQVVSGVGFIGAGCILHDRGTGAITGLTTASTLWLTACVGIAAGLGYYVLCLEAVAIIVPILYVLRKVQKRNTKKENESEETNVENK